VIRGHFSVVFPFVVFVNFVVNKSQRRLERAPGVFIAPEGDLRYTRDQSILIALSGDPICSGETTA